MKAQHHSTTFTSADIERYLNKEMTPEEMHAMEKAALDDPFLADAIEGYAEVGGTGAVQSFSADVGELTSRLQERIHPAKKEGRAIPFKRNHWWRVAAAVMLLAGTAGLVYTVMNTAAYDAKEQLARKESSANSTPDPAATADSVSIGPDAASASEKPVMEKTAPPPVVSKNKSITETPADQTAATQAARMKDAESAVGDLAKENVEEKSTAGKEAIQQEMGREKQATVAAAPAAARQQNEVFRGEASNNAAVFPPFVANSFNGRVVDQDNKPIAGATVIVENKNVGVSTDKDGQFNVILPDSNIKVKIAYVGFETASLTLKNNLIDNRIVLKQSDAALSEVVVTGYGTRKKRAVSSNANDPVAPAPTIGWDAYETYLSKNKRRPAGDTTSGTVIISFSTNKSGKPTNLKIEKSLKSALDAEALRLVKEGPAWKPAKNKARGRVTITF